MRPRSTPVELQGAGVLASTGGVAATASVQAGCKLLVARAVCVPVMQWAMRMFVLERVHCWLQVGDAHPSTCVPAVDACQQWTAWDVCTLLDCLLVKEYLRFPCKSCCNSSSCCLLQVAGAHLRIRTLVCVCVCVSDDVCVCDVTCAPASC